MSLFLFLCVVLAAWTYIHFCHKMRLTFIRKGYNSSNHVFKFFTRLFTMSQDFTQLCNVVDIDDMYFL